MQPSPIDTVITGGQVVGEDGTVAADILIRDGRIAGLVAPGLAPPADRVIDARGKHVLPGVIDVHVHFREPGMTHKEDWGTGSQAAAVGGVTTVFEMPNTNPPTDTAENFALKHDLAASKSIVDFGLYGLLGAHNVEHLEPLAAAGVIGYKLFMGNTTGDLPCPNDGTILEGFEILARLGKRCSIHAENSPILFRREHAMQAAGRTDPMAHLAARTDVVAVEALNRAATLAEWTGARIHIVHESCARSLDYIRFWKARGVDITVETLPQYLYLDAEMMLEPGGEVIRMNPPIREKAHQEPLWAGLFDGSIDMVSTDHAPHAAEEKRGADIWKVACGFPGVETSLPLMLTAVNAGRLTLEDVVRLMAGAPARAFGLFGSKGVIRVGADADLAIVDMGKSAVLSAEALHSRGKSSPYEGMTVTGLPVATLVRGKTVAKDGQPVAEPGWGKMVRQAMPAPAPRHTETTLAAITVPHQRPFAGTL